MSEYILAATIFAVLFCWLYTMSEKERQYKEEREDWQEERQQLLDRIQAPSYDHLKHHEVKVIKAHKEQPKETINLEVV